MLFKGSDEEAFNFEFSSFEPLWSTEYGCPIDSIEKRNTMQDLSVWNVVHDALLTVLHHLFEVG